REDKSRAVGHPRPYARSMLGDLVARICHAVDRASVVVRNQKRAVLHDLHVDRSPNIFVVLEEAGKERLPRLHTAVLVQLGDADIATDLLRPVPGAVVRDEDRVAVFWRKHGARVEAHTERGRVRTQQGDWLLELVARAAPA